MRFLKLTAIGGKGERALLQNGPKALVLQMTNESVQYNCDRCGVENNYGKRNCRKRGHPRPDWVEKEGFVDANNIP